MPGNLEEYVHRIGRTARMGRQGTAITFVSEWDFEILDMLQAHLGDELQPGNLVLASRYR
jgi:superfamily II DNA/RNA helicase